MDNFVIGTPILNRTNYVENQTPGMFISTIRFKVNLQDNISFKDFATNIELQTMWIFRHKKYQYQEILEHVRQEDSSIPNLYNVLISYQINHANKNISDIPFEIEWTHPKYTSDPLDIHLADVNDSGSLTVHYDYQIDKFNEIDIEKMHKRIVNVITQILSNPDINIFDIELVYDEEKNFLLNSYNSSKKNPITKTVIDLFEEQVQQNPDNIAICDKTHKLTYSQLNNIANKIAQNYISKGIVSGDKICIFLDNSIELVASILAILKLGACYIPIDTAYPDERIQYILENSSAKYIITNNKLMNKLSVPHDQIISIQISYIIRNYSNNSNIENINNSSLDELSYIIYTSGSTGKPKGVQISGKNLANYITWANTVYVCGKPTNFPLYSSIAFDLTVTSVYTPLISGNAIYIYKNTNPQILLKNIVEDNKVQILKLTPAHLTLLADYLSTAPNSDKELNKLIVGGDILTTDLCHKITDLFDGNIHIYNEYGPTEATVGCMIYEYKISDDTTYVSTPIGTPAANTNLYIMNNHLNLLPIGYSGNLYISGDSLSRGYLNMPSKTNSSFIISPINGERLYNTGDLAEIHSNGIMEYLSRSDLQIKLNGYRIEIGEIRCNYFKISKYFRCFHFCFWK